MQALLLADSERPTHGGLLYALPPRIDPGVVGISVYHLGECKFLIARVHDEGAREIAKVQRPLA